VEEIKQLLARYPYLTYLTYGGNDYVGIVQNVDDIITTIYDYSILRTADEKAKFLELGDVWWWESNRGIPINLFLKQDWAPFRIVLRTLNSKDVEIKLGPYVSLKEMSLKRSKRRSITLVRKM